MQIVHARRARYTSAPSKAEACQDEDVQLLSPPWRISNGGVQRAISIYQDLGVVAQVT
jgi:hypothetical protein